MSDLTAVFLAGGFSPPPIAEAAGRSPLDLFVSPAETVCDRWVEALRVLGTSVRIEETLCVCGGSVPGPRCAASGVRVVADQSDYRGPAGALRDAVRSTRGEGLILVAEAARVCGVDLRAFLEVHLAREAAVTVAAHEDGSPAGLYLLSRAALELIPERGFMDLKEQWLGRVLGEGMPVWVHQVPTGSCPPIRTRTEYLRAVLSGVGDASAPMPGPAFEPRMLLGTGQSGSILCTGAMVDADSIVVDSVVMPGATVEAGAIIIRSLVCSETRVREGQPVIDSVVGPRGPVSDFSTHLTESSA